MKKILDNLKKILTKNIGITILVVLVLIFAIFTFAYLFNARNVSSIEEKEIKNNSSELVNYLEDITLSKSKEIDKYILFALDYSYNVNGKDSMTVSELNDFFKKHFTKKFTEETIKNIGITPLLLEKNVTFDVTSNAYKLNNIRRDNATIAETPITYYKLEGITKINKKKYRATYRTYTIKNPYDILNYYLDKNSKTEGVEKDGVYTYDLKDVTPIKNYLSGSGKISSLKKAIDDDVAKYAKKGKKVKITYVIKNDKVLIDKIK